MDCKQLRHDLALAAGGDEATGGPLEPALAPRLSPAMADHLARCEACRRFGMQLKAGLSVLRAVATEGQLAEASSTRLIPPRPAAHEREIHPGLPVTLQSLASHLPDRTSSALAIKTWAEMKRDAGLETGHSTRDRHQAAGRPAASGSRVPTGYAQANALKSGPSNAGWYPAIAAMAASVLVAATLTNPLITPDGDWSSSGDRVATRNLFGDPTFQQAGRMFQNPGVQNVSLEQTWETPPAMPEFPPDEEEWSPQHPGPSRQAPR